MKRIMFPLLWVASHSGDNAIWTKLIKAIESVFPGSEYICPVQYSPTDEVIKWDIDQLKKITPNIKVVPMGIISGFNRDEFKELKTKGEVINYMRGVKPSKYLEEADIMISQGGGYMFNDACYDLYLPPFYIAQRLGKLTYFNTQTFTGSDFTPATRLLGNMVFEKAKYISPREMKSVFNLYRYFDLKRELSPTPDFTFDIPPEPYEKELPQDSIKFNIRSDVGEKPLEMIARTADMVVETMGPVVFMPICHGGDRDDRILHRKIASLMTHESVLIEDELTAGQAMTIAKDGITVTDRYHTAVFSVASNTPIVPLVPDIDFKMGGLLRLLDYPRVQVLDLRQTNSEELFRYISRVWKERNILRGRFEAIVPHIKQRVTDATDELCRFLKTHN